MSRINFAFMLETQCVFTILFLFHVILKFLTCFQKEGGWGQAYVLNKKMLPCRRQMAVHFWQTGSLTSRFTYLLGKLICMNVQVKQ